MASKPVHAHLQKTVAEGMLLQKGPFDARDELEGVLLESFTRLQTQLKPPFQLRSRSGDDHLQLNQALVYGILTQQQAQQSYIMHLVAVTRDGYVGFVTIVLCLVRESYVKLLEQPREHLLWLVRQLINFSAAEVDTLCLLLLRCVVGGDISHWNIWLAGQMLDVLSNNWSWLIEHSALLTGALFAYLRLIPDHFVSNNPIVTELRKDEVAFCVKVLRDRFQDCLVIGRDLVRLLQDVACIPEFEVIWKDLLLNPASFNANGFADISQLYLVRTPARFLISRLTPQMEAQIRFMLTNVRMGSQLRYQAWFVQRFLASPGSGTLVCDIIRFICCVHHPTNQILQSDIVPRWALVGWLLKCCKSHHVEANAKLALFYDWLFFVRKADNLMNIEPALLLMMYSIPKYIDLTQSLLDFLFLCIEHYDPQRKDLILCGVRASMDILLEKGVVQSLQPLFSSPHLAVSLRKKLKEYFPMYCHVLKNNIDDGPLAEGISKVPSVPVVAQTSVSTQSAHNINETDGGAKNLIERERLSIGVMTRDAFGETLGSSSGKQQTVADTLGSPSVKQQNILVEEAVSNKVLGNVGALELMAAREYTCGTPENTFCKKRRTNFVTLDEFSKSMHQLREKAVEIFEDFLSTHLSSWEGIISGRTLEGTPNCCPENYEETAKGVSSIMKGSNFHFFAPLQGPYSKSLEEDEIMSVTSAVLHWYTRLRHPGLLQMLLFWHAEGFAVGPRLLCYSCRVAEDTNSFTMSASAGSKIENTYHACKKHEKKVTPLPEKERNVVMISSRSWHAELNDVANQDTSIGQKTVEMACTTEPPLAVKSCFAAYEEFLKGLRNRGKTSREQLILLDDRHQRNLSEGQADDELQSFLAKDLETCSTWSIPRLQSILPVVFNYLPDLSTGNEKITRLLVSTVAPMDLPKLELKLNLKELSVFGKSLSRVQNLFKNSLLWDSCEQHYFWRLLLAEWDSSLSLTEFVKYCNFFLKPDQHYEAVSGLLSLLRVNCPTVILVSTLLDLPRSFNQLVAAVFATWTTVHTSRFLECFRASISNGLQEEVEFSDCLSKLPQSDSFRGSALSILWGYLNNVLKTKDFEDDNTHMEIRKIQMILLKMAEKSQSRPCS